MNCNALALCRTLLRPLCTLPAVQDVQLHMAVGDNFEHVALTLYQCGTLQVGAGEHGVPHSRGPILWCSDPSNGCCVARVTHGSGTWPVPLRRPKQPASLLHA